MFVTRRMQRAVATISPSASLREARSLMRTRNVRQLPVTGEGNKLVGILSDRDIREAMLPVGLLPGSSEKEMEEMLAGTTVEKVMTRKVATAAVNDSLEDAIVLLHDFRVNALPVVDDEGRLAGIITRTDVLKAFIEALGIGEISSRLEVPRRGHGRHQVLPREHHERPDDRPHRAGHPGRLLPDRNP
jgi:acetoin utilization protein AcuB